MVYDIQSKYKQQYQDFLIETKPYIDRLRDVYQNALPKILLKDDELIYIYREQEYIDKLEQIINSIRLKYQNNN